MGWPSALHFYSNKTIAYEYRDLSGWGYKRALKKRQKLLDKLVQLENIENGK